MEFPESHPDIEKILKEQGLDEELCGIVMSSVICVCMGKQIDALKAMSLIANGLLSYVNKMEKWKLTPEGMKFTNWCAENPKEAYKTIEKYVALAQIMKNRMN